MREKLKTMIKRLTISTVAFVMAGSITPGRLSEMVGVEPKVQAATTLSNPRIVEDSSMQAGQKVTWDCVWFGSYPQTEIVDKPETSGCYGKPWEKSTDYEVEAEIYNTLTKCTDWDAHGDTNIDGKKYKRLKISDATYHHTYDEYYDWGNT